MKRIALLLLCFALAAQAFAQADYLNYQGIARNAGGQPLTNQTIGVQVLIKSDFLGSTTHYAEKRTVTTNQFGLFSFLIGSPGATTIPFINGNMATVNWSQMINPRFAVSIDVANNGTFVSLPETPVAAVPFAKMATEAKPWKYDASLSSIFPENASWKLALGTVNATERLHVLGNVRVQNGNVGINVASALDRLHVVGNIRMVDGLQGVDKVLTSDANGTASWKPLSSNGTGLWTEGTTSVTSKPALVSKPYTSLSRFIVHPSALPAVQNFANRDHYPLSVEGGQHGIAIKLQNFVYPLNHQNKFITFFDSSNNIKGRIEGQSLGDLGDDREFIMFNFFRTTLLAEYGAEAVAAGVQLDFFEVAVNTVAATAMGAEWFTQLGFWEAEVGVAYQSSSGDYAEWLERADPLERFSFGDIVEVVGGKISKNITGKGQLMVISMAPIVLGNSPSPEKEQFFEKVAFMGQVPVKITGDVTVGDYIICSGENDGMGYAVHPANITPDEYKRMVGVAWSASSGKVVSLVNTAVGLQTAAVVEMVKKQEELTAKLAGQVNQLGSYLAAKDPSFKFEAVATKPLANLTAEKAAPVASKQVVPPATSDRGTAMLEKYKASLTPERVKKLLEEHPDEFTKTWQSFKDGMLQMTNTKHFDLNKNPELKKLVYDREAFVNNIKKAYGLL